MSRGADQVEGRRAVLELLRAGRRRVHAVLLSGEGLDADGDATLFELTVADQPLVLVLGAEGRGLSRLTRERCDVVAGIPMHGAIESLNVSAAAALACYEIARRRQ